MLVSHIILPRGSICRVHAPTWCTLRGRSYYLGEPSFPATWIGSPAGAALLSRLFKICGVSHELTTQIGSCHAWNSSPQFVQTMIDIETMLKWGCFCSLSPNLWEGLFSLLMSDSLSWRSRIQVQGSEVHRLEAIVLLRRRAWSIETFAYSPHAHFTTTLATFGPWLRYSICMVSFTHCFLGRMIMEPLTAGGHWWWLQY